MHLDLCRPAHELYTFIKLEVLIEKGSAAVSCDANRTKTVCRTAEQMNSFLLSQ